MKKRCGVVLGLSIAFTSALLGEELFATSNYWGGARKDYRKRVLGAAAVLSTNGSECVIRDWYCSIPNLPIFDDGVAPMPWLEEKAFLLYYLSTVSPIRNSTNCWFAAADALRSCRVLLAQCEADFSRREPLCTNTMINGMQQSKMIFQMRWNRLVSARKSEPLLAEAVTNKFPNCISAVVSEDELEVLKDMVYRRAGLLSVTNVFFSGASSRDF